MSKFECRQLLECGRRCLLQHSMQAFLRCIVKTMSSGVQIAIWYIAVVTGFSALHAAMQMTMPTLDSDGVVATHVRMMEGLSPRNIPIGVQRCAIGDGGSITGVYPFAPCTEDGCDVFRPQMVGGSSPWKSDVVAWIDQATDAPVTAWRLVGEGASLSGELVFGDEASIAVPAHWSLRAGDVFTFSRRAPEEDDSLLLTGYVAEEQLPESPWYDRMGGESPRIVRVDVDNGSEAGEQRCSLVVSNTASCGFSVLSRDLVAIPEAVPVSGWRIAQRFPSPGMGDVVWTDPMPLSGTNGAVRLYMVKGDGEDSDQDGLPDWWEMLHGFDPLSAFDADGDPDEDGYSNLREFQLGYDPGFRDLPEGEVCRGLVARNWFYRSSISSSSAFATMLPQESFVYEGDFAFSPTNVPWSGFGSSYLNLFALSFRGWVRIDVPGEYLLHLGADDGAALYLDGVLAVDNDGDHGWRWRSSAVSLTRGWHRLLLDYFENWGDAGLRLEWTPPGNARCVVPENLFAHLADEEARRPALVLEVPEKRFAAGNAVSVKARAWDAMGRIVRVDFYEGGTNLFASCTEEPYETVWHPVPADSPELVAVAWNDSGFSATVTARVDVASAPGAGYRHGLETAYYSFAQPLSSLPDLTGRTPDVSCVENDIVAPIGTLGGTLWPVDATNDFAVAYEGWVVIARPGEYEFSLGSDDGSRLLMDGEVLIDAPAPQAITARNVSCALAAGFHRLRVEYFQKGGLKELWLKWRRPGDLYFEFVPPVAFFSALGTSATADSDGDGMTDWWEGNFGLDSLDPSDADVDADGDGLSNLAEFRQGTNPLVADTDGDGIPDAWEMANGLNPLLASDGEGDADGDGASNSDEYKAGTSLVAADTDGDGVSDGEEILFAGSDPLVGDYDGTCTTNLILRAEDVDFAYGAWLREEERVLLAGRCGTVFYTNSFSFADSGVRQLRFRAVSSLEEASALVCRVDGIEIGRRVLPVDACSTNDCAFQTPYLAAGRHALVLEFQNFRNGARFSFGEIFVTTPGGPDGDGNGRPDWMDACLSRSRAECPPSVVSKISPYCLRGQARTVPLVRVDGGRVRPLPGSRWWRNVPLNPANETRIEIDYENGGRQESRSISWAAFDVLAESDVTLRAGDSLLLTLGDGGPASSTGILRVEGVTNAVLAAGERFPFRFDEAGTFVLNGTMGARSGRVVVTVVGGGFGRETVPAWRGKINTFSFPAMPAGVPVPDVDEGVYLVSRSEQAEGSVWVLDVYGRERAANLAVYVDNPDASVLDSVQIDCFDVSYTTDGVYHAHERLSDGTGVVVNRISAFDLPPGVTFSMRSQSGVCFEDGASTVELGPSDFDETGEFWYRFYVPKGLSNPCQFLHAYLDGKEIAQ